MADALKTSPLAAKGEALHQLLHGYSEGHRLLESSFKLQDDLVRLVLRMSDLSGSNMVNGFENYITGYPLASINAYALAKTWNAPEMPRPGCVWTHTIVIPGQVMSKIPSLNTILTLFKRPEDGIFQGQYNKELFFDKVIDADEMKHSQKEEDQKAALGQLLTCFYKMDAVPLVMAAKNSTEFENMLFMLWSQQWPCLRLGFSFCTGSLSARNIAGRPFDVQCVPKTLTREVLLEIDAASLIKPILISSAQSSSQELLVPNHKVNDAWMSSAIDDVLNPLGGPLRDFLWAASDNETSRSDYGSIITAFDELKKTSDPNILISLIAQLFPQPSSGRQLKRLLFGGQSSRAFASSQAEPDVLFALATTGNYQSFEADTLSTKLRGAKLYVEKQHLARSLVEKLLRSTLNPLGEEILAGLISAMDPEKALQVAHSQPQFLPAIFRAEPSLASSPQLWLAGRDYKRELFDSVVAHDNLDSSLITGLVSALLESDSDILLQRAFDRWGKTAVFQALDWTEAHNGAMSTICRMALTFFVPLVMEWVEAKSTRSTESLVAVSHIVAPYSNSILKHNTSTWLRPLHELQNNSNEVDRTYLCSFLVALAFGNAPPSPLDLIAECFEQVHKSASKRLLKDDAWVILEPILPILPWYSNWDKCERLRRGLIIAFVCHKWSASELKKRITDQELLQDLFSSARYVEGGEMFFEHYP